jgi:hypothetical protein
MALSRVNDPVSCPICGGVFFIELSAQLYNGGNYGMRPISQTPQKIFMCLCGNLTIPGNIRQGVVPGTERGMFIDSFDAAQAAHLQQQTDQFSAIRNNLAGGIASLAEFNELKDQVDDLERQVTGEPPASVEEEEEGTVEESAAAPVVEEPALAGEVATPGATMHPPGTRSGRPAPGTSQIIEREDRRPKGTRNGASARMPRQGA